MSKKLFLALMLGLISTNSLYAMKEEGDEERSTVARTQVNLTPEGEIDTAEMFAKTVTVKIADGYWAHVYPTHNAARAYEKAWVTTGEAEGSPQIAVGTIYLELDIGGRPLAHTVNNTSVAELTFYGSSFHHATAKAWFTDPKFGTYGPVIATAK